MRRRQAKIGLREPQMSSETERAERHRQKSLQKRSVWTRPGNLRFGGTGWWRQKRSKLGAHHAVSEPVSNVSHEREFAMQRLTGKIRFFVSRRPVQRRGVDSKSPRSVGQMHGYPAKFDPYGLGGGRDRDRTCDPLDVNEVLSR
jgi:hypothetical protein